jgi:hypothetical protein
VQKRKTNVLLWTIAIAMGFGVSGCIKSSMPEPTPARAYVSVMHLAPTAPAFDVFFNDTKVSTNAFTPGSVSAAYNPVERGDFLIKLKKAGEDSLVATVPQERYDSLHFYTILVFNLQVNGPAQAVRIEDKFGNLTSGKSYYRFFHASPNLDAVDLYVDNAKIQSVRRMADNASQESLNTFGEIDQGSHTFQVKLAGTDSVLVTKSFIDLAAGNAYTLYLRGLGGGSGSSQLSLEFLRAAN